MGVLDGWRSSKGKGKFWERGTVGHLIVTNEDFVSLPWPVRGGDTALPKLLWDFSSVK